MYNPRSSLPGHYKLLLTLLAANSGSIRIEPANQSSGPLAEGCVPIFVISTLIVINYWD
jgi:hypothetical protein